ncbi:hypothetical protein [Desulfospira joergensenii]|uniref:hypothetical protein n=1 Tax=Desulfospira joergensenii TaxID=53329 RepID=UPI0004118A25|nr:hypothetical protein [Desulfospira joergensenii]
MKKYIIFIAILFSASVWANDNVGKVYFGENLAKTLSEHTDRLYLKIDDSENLYFNRQHSGPVIGNLNIHTDHMVKVYFDDQICESWKLNFSKLKTQAVIIRRLPGSWRMEPASDTALPGQSAWSCEELKSKHLTNPRVYLTFSKAPDINSSGSFWELTWNNVNIPIPKTEYTDVLASKGYRSTMDILLKTRGGIKILAAMLPDRPVDDIFQTESLEKLPLESSLDGQSMTRKIYGGPVRLSRINRFGFSITPDNLICDAQTHAEQAAVSIALILKNIESPGKLLSVHKLTGIYDGWMEKQFHGGNFEYTLTILSDSEKESLCQVSYMIPEKSVYKDLPYQIGRGEKRKTNRLPKWLDMFNRALKIQTKKSWKAYAREARKQGIRPESIAGTLTNPGMD